MGDYRLPPHPVPGTPSSSYLGSSTPSATSAIDDQANTLSTSPGGRLTFVFPSTRLHPMQRSFHGDPLAELSSSGLLPSSTETKRRIVLPGESTPVPLKLIAEDTLADVFGSSTNRSAFGSAPQNLVEWVTSSRQTIVPSKGRVEGDQDNVGGE